jgi:hypothetical protein
LLWYDITITAEVGGGATKYEAELRKTYGMDGTIRGSAGGFQQMTQDALTVLNDIPFSIPPYFALLGKHRSIYSWLCRAL